MADACEVDNEPLGSIKFGEFLDLLSVLLASREGLRSMETVYTKTKQLLSGTCSLLNLVVELVWTAVSVNRRTLIKIVNSHFREDRHCMSLPARNIQPQLE